MSIIAPLGILLTALALYLTYKYTGAEDLRTKVYQPLYSDISRLEEALLANNPASSFSSDVLNSLKRSGDFQRLPGPLRKKIEETYQAAHSVQAELAPLTEFIQRQVSAKIIPLRTIEGDKEWARRAAAKLQESEGKKKGVSPIRSFTFRHAGRGPTLDVRDPNNPIIALPGGPTWQINDWISYPRSVLDMESIWTDTDFLYFDDAREDWYYRITREDLERNGTDLMRFLDPIHRVLSDNPNYQQLQKIQPAALRSVKDLNTEIANRVRDPKRIRDLF